MNLNEQATCLTDDYRTIPLTRGQVAVVDAADFDWLSRWKWHASRSRHTWYAARKQVSEGRRLYLRMHRVIIGAKHGEQVDHWDGNGLNNVRRNLRLATNSLNQANKRSHNRFRGVFASGDKWYAQIKVNYKSLYLGIFPSEELAARAYDSAATQHFGEFARLNFPCEVSGGR